MRPERVAVRRGIDPDAESELLPGERFRGPDLPREDVQRRFRVDPAYGSGPVATVIQDILSLLVYFTVLRTFGI